MRAAAKCYNIFAPEAILSLLLPPSLSLGLFGVFQTTKNVGYVNGYSRAMEKPKSQILN